MNAKQTNSVSLVKAAAKIIAEKKGEDIVAFNVSESSNITDYYLLASGLNPPHLKALFNETQFTLKNQGFACFRKAGTPESGWIVADYLEIIIHFFGPENRTYYALDELYKNLPKISFTEEEFQRQEEGQ